MSKKLNYAALEGLGIEAPAPASKMITMALGVSRTASAAAEEEEGMGGDDAVAYADEDNADEGDPADDGEVGDYDAGDGDDYFE